MEHEFLGEVRMKMFPSKEKNISDLGAFIFSTSTFIFYYQYSNTTNKTENNGIDL